MSQYHLLSPADHMPTQTSIPIAAVYRNTDQPCFTLQDRIASLNGRTVQLVIRQDRPAFIRLIGISVLQSAASAVLAPSLRQVADALAMTWRRRLTTAAHARYFKGNTFYTTSQLAGRPCCCAWLVILLCRAVLTKVGCCRCMVYQGGLISQVHLAAVLGHLQSKTSFTTDKCQH